MIEIMFSAVDSLSSINSFFNIWSCNKHIEFASINDVGDIELMSYVIGAAHYLQF